MDTSYWLKQTPTKPLFPDIEWSKPEQRSKAGRLVIIGGNAQGFASLADTFSAAEKTGVGETRLLLPDSLQKALPSNLTQATFLPSNPSGGFSKKGWQEMQAAVQWADGILLPGDTGRNSETTMMLEKLLASSTLPTAITRDAIDILSPIHPKLVERKQTLLVLSFAQVQKLLKNVYYPKVVTFSMSLQALVEVLHKFTITYPCTLMVFHNNNLIVAHQGKVSSTPFTSSMEIWRGNTAARAISYWIWHQKKPFEAISTSII